MAPVELGVKTRRQSPQIGSNMFLHKLVGERDLFCFVSWIMNYGMECRTKFLQEDDKDGKVDEE